MKKIIKLTDVTKTFGKLAAVDNVSLSVDKGEIVGFVGPNGAGKTTTISMLLGFIKPSVGTVELFGQNILPQTAHSVHKKIGYAAGDMALFDNLTGEQYLDFFANQYGSSKRRNELIQALLPKITSKLKHLSRGNKQKIALIGALQHEPELIILDEPTSGLDPLMQKTFLNLLEAEKARGATIFMSSHILSEVAEVSDRVIFMRDGKIIINQAINEIKGREGKLVKLYGAKAFDKKQLPKNANNFEKTGINISFEYSGDANTLLGWLAKQKITDFIVEQRTLDDLFEHLYENEKNK